MEIEELEKYREWINANYEEIDRIYKDGDLKS